MDIEIPNKQTRRWSGIYQGNYYGDLWKTFNVDLESDVGHIALSRNFSIVADTSDTDDTGTQALGTVVAFLRTNASNIDRWYAISGGSMFTTDSSSVSIDRDNPYHGWRNDTVANSPVGAQDMTVHENDPDSAGGENVLLVTRDTAVASLNDTGANTWNSNAYFHTSPTALRGGISGLRHPIEYFSMRRISIVGDGNLIHTIDKNKASAYARLTLPVDLLVNHIFVTAYRVWILCYGLKGKNGAIVEWDGSSETYNQIYDAKSVYPLSGVNYNEIPIVINDRGVILEYNGNGFSPMVRNGQIIALPISEEIGNSLSTGISARGMTVSDDGLIYINVSAPTVNSIKQLGGIWCLNPNTGTLYSKYSLGHGGDSDFGQQRGIGTGAIKAVNYMSGNDPAFLVVGGYISNSVGSTKNFIWAISRTYSTSAGLTRGYFITQFIPADDVQEYWETIWLRLSSFRSSTYDSIVVKARGVRPMLSSTGLPLEKTITWTSTTTFTVTLGATDDALAVGDEVEVVGGKNAGYLAHITTITGNHGALQTITIDDAVKDGTSTSYARFDRWKKLGVINDVSKYFVPLNLGISSSFIKFKVEMRGKAGDFGIKNLGINFKKQTSKLK